MDNHWDIAHDSLCFLGRSMGASSEYSEDVASRIDMQVRSIIQYCHVEAINIIKDKGKYEKKIRELKSKLRKSNELSAREKRKKFKNDLKCIKY